MIRVGGSFCWYEKSFLRHEKSFLRLSETMPDSEGLHLKYLCEACEKRKLLQTFKAALPLTYKRFN